MRPTRVPPAWAIALPSLLLFLAAAKAHGRAVRLERELAGYPDVDFRSAYEHPVVSEMWRRDRVGFWTRVPVASALLAAATWSLTRPNADWALVAVAALLWAPVVGFATLGLAATARRRARAAREPTLAHAAEAREPAWGERARRGDGAWWACVAGLAGAVATIGML